MRKPTLAIGGSAASAGPRRWRAGLVAAALLGMAATSCNKKTDNAPRPSALAPAPAGSAPAAPPAPGKAAEGAAGPTITGTIVLAPARKGDVSPNDAVYLSARRIADNPQARGSLVAVKRFTASSFPIEFTLGAGDMMFKNGAFEGDLTLSARVDKDGDPMTRRKGDVFGLIDRVKVGSAGVTVTLDQVQKEDESLLGGAPPAAQGLPPGHP